MANQFEQSSNRSWYIRMSCVLLYLSVSFLLVSCGEYTVKDQVLAEFDHAESMHYRFFFDPDHGYFHLANSRISLFADEKRWAIVIEKNGYANRGFNTQIELNYFGNCLHNQETAGADNQFVCNMKYFTLFDDSDVCFDDPKQEEFEILDPDKHSLKIRGQEIEIVHDLKPYQKSGIEIYDSMPSVVEFTRLLAETRPEVLWATDEELRTCLPQDLPLIGQITEWHHDPETLFTLSPSDNESYQMLAECIEKRSLAPYQPTLPPNNHWSFWPDSGGL